MSAGSASRRLRFEQFLLPGIVFQSVLIGGAYATGREIVQYGARFGAVGLNSLSNKQWTTLTNVIRKRHGTVDKYMGDCSMAY